MALSNFFSIYMPYGLKKNDLGEWFVFNREYMPLGWNSIAEKKNTDSYTEFPIRTKFNGLNEKNLLSIAGSEEFVRRDDAGKIEQIFLYNDNTNPFNPPNDTNWEIYSKKLKDLGKLKIS